MFEYVTSGITMIEMHEKFTESAYNRYIKWKFLPQKDSIPLTVSKVHMNNDVLFLLCNEKGVGGPELLSCISCFG